MATRTAKPTRRKPPRIDPGSVRLPFGSYRGSRIEEVPIAYLQWVLDHFDDLWPYVREAIEDYLEEISDG